MILFLLLSFYKVSSIAINSANIVALNATLEAIGELYGWITCVSAVEGCYDSPACFYKEISPNWDCSAFPGNIECDGAGNVSKL
jgi:hypothetical protein